MVGANQWEILIGAAKIIDIVIIMFRPKYTLKDERRTFVLMKFMSGLPWFETDIVPSPFDIRFSRLSTASLFSTLFINGFALI